MCGQEITQVAEAKFLGVKFLGVKFDSKLSFTPHVQQISEICTDRLKLIKILSHPSLKLNQQVLINIYKSLVRSIMEYSSFIAKIINRKLLNKLQIIKNKALRNLKRQFMIILSVGGNFSLTSLAPIQLLLGNFGKQ